MSEEEIKAAIAITDAIANEAETLVAVAAAEAIFPLTESVVVKTTPTADPQKQKALVEISTPTFSHDEELPLKIRIAKTKWWGRKRLLVTTLEEVWYRDAVNFVRIPPNKRSDLGTIPPIVWWIVSPWDIALESLFHDELYTSQVVRRYVADTALRSMMEERGKPWWVVLLVYVTVRMFGGWAWRKHAAENAAAKAAAELPPLPE